MCLHDPFCPREVQKQGAAQTNTHTTLLKSSDSAVLHRALWTRMSLPICLVHSVEQAPGATVLFDLEPENHIKF